MIVISTCGVDTLGEGESGRLFVNSLIVITSGDGLEVMTSDMNLYMVIIN